jgi:transposase
LNPNDLVQIYSSLKKTDKEDALKIARIVLRNPVEELPIVHMPTLENEEHRRLLSEHGFWTNNLTKLKNRFHSVFQLNSMIHVSRSNFKIPSRRIILMKELNGTLLAEAQRMNNQIIQIEKNIKDIENLMKEVLRENIAYTELTMSIPGVGLITAFTFFSYLGDCSRFKSSKSIAFYAGLVPRVDISGKKAHYGSIIKRGCRPIRRIILQSSWALIRSAEGGPLKEFYLKKYTGIGKKKAAVAVARKMITTFYSMMNSGELYRGTTEKSRIRRLKHYGLYVKT